jgi:arylsulfatase
MKKTHTIALGLAVALCVSTGTIRGDDRTAARPNILLILADDLGFSDLGCYGSEIATPNLDRLAAGGLRFTQFYNAARCCPTRAALLTGLYPHQAGVGHMLGDWSAPGYTSGLNDRCVTIADLLRDAGYRTYQVGKWHVGRPQDLGTKNWPLQRGFDCFYGTGGGGNYFAPELLVRDNDRIRPEADDFYVTDAFTEAAVNFLDDHARDHANKPFFVHLCYTAPHFPLHARPEDIAKYRGKYRVGWDAIRERRYERQKQLGIIDPKWRLSPRDQCAAAWNEISDSDKDEWDLRMAVFAAMVDRMDQGIGKVVDTFRKIGAGENTLVLFLSDNGSSAEFLDNGPGQPRGHTPGAVTGTKDSHRCLEVGWANAGNTPFREHKMWVHEGGISTPLIAYWPAAVKQHGQLTREIGHVIDLMPTCLDVAGATYPKTFRDRELTPASGRSLLPILQGKSRGDSTPLFWEHEGNRAVRQGKWKLVAEFRGPWQLYNIEADRTELKNLAASHGDRVTELATLWQSWAERAGVVPWESLPGASYRPSTTYRRKSEPAEK